MSTQKTQHTQLLKDKALYTLFILTVFTLARNIPLALVDTEAYETEIAEGGALMQAISGDLRGISLLALGFSAYMIASLLVQLVLVIGGKKLQSRISKRTLGLARILLMLAIILPQAVRKARTLVLSCPPEQESFYRFVCALELIGGVMLSIRLGSLAKEKGIGGMSALILVNILDGLLKTVRTAEVQKPFGLLAICLLVLLISVVTEHTEKRIPVQRISIHNVYSEKNYLAIKLNPAGITPVMFATVGFMLVRGALFLLSAVPGLDHLAETAEGLKLTELSGIAVYIGILYLLTIFFALIMINPKDIAEQFAKSGDCLTGIRAGKPTRRYLRRSVFRMSLYGATITSLCIAGPMLLAAAGLLDTRLMMLPTSILMLVGIWTPLWQEAMVLRDYDSYRTFV